LEEGKKIKDKLLAEKQLLENIKDKKLNGLYELNVPDRYTAELAKKKIVIWILFIEINNIIFQKLTFLNIKYNFVKILLLKNFKLKKKI